jgi:hypothetical protein
MPDRSPSSSATANLLGAGTRNTAEVCQAMPSERKLTRLGREEG